jgi:hypothetical protein
MHRLRKRSNAGRAFFATGLGTSCSEPLERWLAEILLTQLLKIHTLALRVDRVLLRVCARVCMHAWRVGVYKKLKDRLEQHCILHTCQHMVCCTDSRRQRTD